MSLRNKIGQMLIMGFSGHELTANSPVAQWLQQDGLGGVLLFDYDLHANCQGKNLKNRAQIKQLNAQLNYYATVTGDGRDPLPLFIAIDYEGGAVDRLAKIAGCMPTLKASEQALLTDDALFAEAEKMAITLRTLGFNLNFAPVVDLDLVANEGIIGRLGRSFSAEPNQVIRAARQVVKAFSQQGIMAAYKHFPGHGSASGDTHEGFVDVSDSFLPAELEPYAALLQDQESPVMVMTAHVINRQLDPAGLPATLSLPILTGLLRKQLGFNGVIVSDDLQMKAISHHYSLDESLRLTINAGADMLIFGNQLGNIAASDIIDSIEKLVKSGAIETARIEQAYQRIVCLKRSQQALATVALLD